MKTQRSIEPLEPRIAPAAVLINTTTKTATWTDWDGDLVTLKYSSATQPSFFTEDKGAGLLVDKISMDAQAYANASVSITVKAAGGGDGHLDLGRVSATGIALKSWSSPAATIAEFDCGDGTKSVGTFNSGALGAIAYTIFKNTGGDGKSELKGAFTSFTVRGDLGATALAIGATGLVSGTVNITGSMRGDAPGNVDQSGLFLIHASTLTSVTIGGSIVGGDGPGEGELIISTTGLVGKVTVKGSVIGGSGSGAGKISLYDTTSLSIGGSLIGGNGFGAGTVDGEKIGTFTLGGSIVGGSVSGTGFAKFESANSVFIKGSIVGGQNTMASGNGEIGLLEVDGNLKSLTIAGDLVAGTYGSGDHVPYNGAVLVDGNLGSATIKGSILGNTDYKAIILAGGVAPATPGNYHAIGKLTVGGDVSYAYIAAGHAAQFQAAIGAAENPDAGIGSVTVGGNWFHSNLSAGISDLDSDGLTMTDTRAQGQADRHAVIGPVIIKGYALDNPNTQDYSGFVAEKIASITVHGTKVFQSGGAAKFLDFNGYVYVAEI